MFQSIMCIYFLIGAAHAIAHVMSCPNCQRSFLVVVVAFAEFVINAIGWPIHAARYASEFFRGTSTTMTRERAIELGEEVAAKKIEEFKQSLTDEGNLIEVKQIKGESNAEFHLRAQRVMLAEMEKRQQAREKAGAA